MPATIKVCLKVNCHNQLTLGVNSDSSYQQICNPCKIDTQNKISKTILGKRRPKIICVECDVPLNNENRAKGTYRILRESCQVMISRISQSVCLE
jgi:hypothetical protein